jgi:aldehyde dehydrogenase (NAD+)
VRLGELIAEADLPPGVFGLVTGYGPTAGAALAGHPDVDALAFTGSTDVGREIVKASVGNLKRIRLELGGKSPNLVFADADLDQATAGSALGIFANQGQVCCATSRIFVQREIIDRFTEGLVAQAKAVRLGQPFDPETTMGPLISREQHDRVLGYLAIGRSEGATVAIGGGAGPQAKGYFIAPTVFTDVRNDMRIAQEEIFGPVATVIPFKDENDAVLQGNDTSYGLAAAIFTRDIGRAVSVSRRLKAGTVWINNTMTLGVISPFGGYKQSGFGRKAGKPTIEHYMQTKSVFIKI